MKLFIQIIALFFCFDLAAQEKDKKEEPCIASKTLCYVEDKWVETIVYCDDLLGRNDTLDLQIKLKKEGYDVDLNSKMDAKTKKALVKHNRSNKEEKRLAKEKRKKKREAKN